MSYKPGGGGGIGGTVSGNKVVVSTGSDTVGDSSMNSSGLTYLNNITSDVQYQLDNKQATLVSATNIKTINGASVLGSGDLTVTGSQPDIPLTLIAPSVDETITAGYSAYVSGYYEIADTKTLEIGAGSVFEIG